MENLKPAAEAIQAADAILIGASNGLSITEGLHLFADNQAFQELFGDLRQKYGLRSLLQCMGARWPSEEEKWGFWSRLIHHYCGEYQPTPVMDDLQALIGDRDYFIVTSNGECHFELSGFAPENIFEIEGNWLSMQCARSCHSTLYPTLDLAEKSRQNWCPAVPDAAALWKSTWKAARGLFPMPPLSSVCRHFYAGITAKSWRCWNWALAGATSSLKPR